MNFSTLYYFSQIHVCTVLHLHNNLYPRISRKRHHQQNWKQGLLFVFLYRDFLSFMGAWSMAVVFNPQMDPNGTQGSQHSWHLGPHECSPAANICASHIHKVNTRILSPINRHGKEGNSALIVQLYTGFSFLINLHKTKSNDNVTCWY